LPNSIAAFARRQTIAPSCGTARAHYAVRRHRAEILLRRVGRTAVPKTLLPAAWPETRIRKALAKIASIDREVEFASSALRVLAAIVSRLHVQSNGDLRAVHLQKGYPFNSAKVSEAGASSGLLWTPARCSRKIRPTFDYARLDVGP